MAKKYDVELARIISRASVAKTTIICGTFLIGLTVICVTAYKMTDKPPWLVVILAVITAAAGPSGAAGIIVWLRRKYIAKHHGHNVELQKREDPDRMSSKP